ncbi:hypothetical protein AAZX31_14G169600 [Glycine max]|nr:hypothetical protein GLYMA_14G184351v4 [Glycine max]KAH1095169.1 hypothetical protein GYH30_040458 [Glycine max]
MCHGDDVTTTHLFSCRFGYSVWQRCYQRLGFEQVLPGSSCAYFWHHQGYGHWMTFWLVVIWLIWLQRNTIIFRGKQACVQEVVDSVVFKTWSWVKAYYARDTFSFSD